MSSIEPNRAITAYRLQSKSAELRAIAVNRVHHRDEQNKIEQMHQASAIVKISDDARALLRTHEARQMEAKLASASRDRSADGGAQVVINAVAANIVASS